VRGVVERGVVERGVVDRGDDVVGLDVVLIENPGSVVMATVPGVVLSQAVIIPAAANATPTTRTRVLIWATLGPSGPHDGDLDPFQIEVQVPR